MPEEKCLEFTRAIALCLFDYTRKSWCRGWVVSLSGGADSAAVASLCTHAIGLAVEELGIEAVDGVSMEDEVKVWFREECGEAGADKVNVGNVMKKAVALIDTHANEEKNASNPDVQYDRDPNNITGIRIQCQCCPWNSSTACPENESFDARTDIDFVMFTEGTPLLEQ